MTNPATPESLVVEQVEDPEPLPHEALVRVQAASLNRGELRLVASRPNGWRPGQGIAVVARAVRGKAIFRFDRP